MAEKKTENNKPQQPAKPMDDDDEFEEFDVEGRFLGLFSMQQPHMHDSVFSADWKEEDEDPAKADLWEADWDDTAVSDNFAQQLRTELQQHARK